MRLESAETALASRVEWVIQQWYEYWMVSIEDNRLEYIMQGREGFDSDLAPIRCTLFLERKSKFIKYWMIQSS